MTSRKRKEPQVVLYKQWVTMFLALSREQNGEIMEAIAHHVIMNEEVQVDPVIQPFVDMMLEEIDKNMNNYSERCDKNQDIAVTREANKKHERDTNVTRTCDERDTKGAPYKYKYNNKYKNNNNSSSDEEESEEVSDKPKRSPARFQPPTLEEVREYWKTQGYNSDPDGFWNFYEGIDWKVGKAKTPMKKWKNSAYGWEHREYNTGKNNTPAASTPIVKDDNPFRNMDMDDYHRRFGDL